MTAERPECGRCHTTARDADLRQLLVNLEREHRHDRVPHLPPHFAIEVRCRACREAVRPRRNP